MKVQEAIELLDNLIGMIEDNHGSDYDTALKMAIEALEKQISLERIVEKLEKLSLDGIRMFEDEKYELIRKKEAIEIVKEVGGLNDRT